MENCFIVLKSEDGLRLDKFLALRIANQSRSRLSSWIKDDLVTVNGKIVPARHLVRMGQKVSVNPPPPPPQVLEAELMSLKIVHEDHSLIVVDKPPGLVVHPGAGHPSGTLVNGLLGRYQELSSVGAPFRPGVVHRIDAGTSGLLVFARTDVAHHHLAKQFSSHVVDRVYLALIWDHGLKERGTIETLYGRSPNHRVKFSSKVTRGKRAVTHWETLGTYGPCRLVKLRLETGRTHQIRVHMADLNHPLVGDPLYGRKRRVEHLTPLRQLGYELGLKRQALHASILGIQHPLSGDSIRWHSRLPNDLELVLERLGCHLDEIYEQL